MVDVHQPVVVVIVPVHMSLNDVVLEKPPNTSTPGVPVGTDVGTDVGTAANL